MPSTIESIDNRLSVVEAVVTRIERELFGNGRPGIAEVLQETIRELRQIREGDMGKVQELHQQNIDRMNSIEENQWKIQTRIEENQWKIQTRITTLITVAVTILSVMEFLTGGGVATLRNVIEHWPK